jgi:hypothetical protein
MVQGARAVKLVIVAALRSSLEVACGHDGAGRRWKDCSTVKQLGAHVASVTCQCSDVVN